MLFTSYYKGKGMIGNCHHCHFFYLRNFINNFFYIPWKSRIARLIRVPHIGFAGDNTEVTVLVRLRNISGK